MTLTAEQIKYLNGTAFQELMKLDPDYTEANKRKIYNKILASLILTLSESYWELKTDGKRTYDA